MQSSMTPILFLSQINRQKDWTVGIGRKHPANQCKNSAKKNVPLIVATFTMLKT